MRQNGQASSSRNSNLRQDESDQVIRNKQQNPGARNIAVSRQRRAKRIRRWRDEGDGEVVGRGVRCGAGKGESGMGMRGGVAWSWQVGRVVGGE